MSDAEFNELIDKAMAGRLTPEEEIRWNAILAERPDLEVDVAVGRTLKALPPPPAVSSNFTALVLEGIRREERAGHQKEAASGWSLLRWRGFAKISAIAAITGVLAFAGLQLREQHQAKAGAKTFVGGVNKMAETREAAPEAVVAVFQDFEAIRNLSESSEAVDYDLLKALGR